MLIPYLLPSGTPPPSPVITPVPGQPFLVVSNLPIADDRYFKRGKLALVGQNIYDRGPAAVPWRSGTVQFSGYIGEASASSVEIYLNGSLAETVTTAADGTFGFGVRLSKGDNIVAAKLASSGELVGDTIYLNAFTWATFLAAYATEFGLGRGQLEQLTQDKFFADGVDWDGDAIEPTDNGLGRNFGQYVSGRRLASHSTKAQYRAFLQRIFDAYFYSTTVRSLDEASRAYLGTIPSFWFLKNTFFAKTYGTSNPLLYPYGFRMTRNLTDPLQVEWEGQDIWMYRRWFTLNDGSTVLDADSTYWVYVDALVPTIGLTLKFMKKVTANDYPFREEVLASFIDQVPQVSILTDSDGSVTGVPKTLYVHCQRVPTSLVSVSGSVSGLLSSAEIIPGTGYVSLGVQFTAAQVGAVDLLYNYMVEPKILARITVGATSIDAIEYMSRPRVASGADGSTSGMWWIESQSRANEFIAIFPNYGLLSGVALQDFDTVVDEVLPAHKKLLHGENTIIPSAQFPGPISAELLGTPRMRVPPIQRFGAELLATPRMRAPGTITEIPGELGTI